MSDRPVPTLRRLLRNYSVALGFALGQLGPLDPAQPREQTAIVRIAADERKGSPHDFVSNELAAPNTIITVPLAADDRWRDSCPQIEPTWIRWN